VNPAAQAKLPELRDAEGKAAEAAAAAVRADEARTAAKEAAANAAEERSGAATAAANEAKVGAEKAQARASEARSEALAARTRADKVVAQLEGRAEPDPCTGTAPYDARPSVELLGDGYAQVVQLKDTSTNVGLGVAFESAFEAGSVFMKKSSTSSVSDTHRGSGFGRSLLTPGSANIGLSGFYRHFSCHAVNVYLSKRDKKRSDTSFGWSIAFQGGSVDWTVSPDTGAGATSVTKNAFVYGVDAGPVMRVWPSWIDVNTVMLDITPALAVRGIGGDAATGGFVRQATGRATKVLVGGDLGFELRINQVMATATASYFSGKIPGASGGQLIVTIGFRGGINLARGTLDQDTKNASDSTH
jgi:hypothetical protein